MDQVLCLAVGNVSQATSQSAQWHFEIGPVLQEAHQVWGCMYEDHVVCQFGSRYQKLVGDRFEVDMKTCPLQIFLLLLSGSPTELPHNLALAKLETVLAKLDETSSAA